MYQPEFFNINEFDSPDSPNSGELMDEDFLRKLDEARSYSSIPFVITSGYRTKRYLQDLLNRGYKASKNSAHLQGKAADIAAADSRTRYIILQALLRAGFTRIGISSTFIHCDTATDRDGQLVWTY